MKTRVLEKDFCELIWNGKDQAVLASDIPTKKKFVPCIEESVNWETTQNIFIEGDNLDVLKLLQDEYMERVKMIYIDPPYNTGKTRQYKDKFTHSEWLNMMYPRLKLARNLMKNDGVIFISIDDNEVMNLRKICDEIFGEENFVSEFCWRKTANQANIGNIARVKEYIIVYAKNNNLLILNKIELTDRAKKEYRYSDKNGKFRRSILLHKTRGKYHYKVKTPNGNFLYGPWMKKHNEFIKMNAENKIYWTPKGQEQPYGKIYLHKSKGQIANDFLGIEYGTNQQGSLEVEYLFNNRYFDYPKPVSLLKHIINIGTSNKNLILDFFAGSCTTAHSMLDLNKQDNENRRFIMVQLPESCNEKSEAFKAGYKNIADIGKERIRRVGNKIKAEDPEYKGDLGFKVFKIV